ncbi:AAA family ATPase [Streptomyces sp. WMMC500]|uniref:ATP-binding protein n=1 Tax=Streptomyces sp. WMMC500 TaxID=3015154 RepID=UPI00248B2A2A|nr:LuxR family transcriptional regulator [Streptomyces sp. WMMC500]WBB64262.1 AAA family ATPase [Streptomyces sp. WMMC500]
MTLYGRQKELAALDTLIGAAADGRGQSLVLRGEAGIGKSSLLAYAEGEAHRRGFTVLRAVGWEAERGLAFAALHQLLRPVLDRAAGLPQPQADALGAAVGTGAADGHDRFLVGLAVLSLLAEVAEDAPVLCLVDDAQWIDEPSADALLFAARRLGVERVALLFAARGAQPGEDAGFPAAGLPQSALSRLGRDDALALLAGLDVPAAVRNRVLAESLGNPLALREFGASGPAAAGRPQAAGQPLPAADRVLAAYRDRVRELPEPTRLILLIAAADSRSTLRYVVAAAERMGVGLADLAAAEQRDLVAVVGEFVEFRHPLIRTAAYTAAPLARRLAVHEALAAASGDPDCRARHMASAATGPDEEVAAELEECGRRALARGGPAAAADTYAEAARLTPDAAPRVRRLTAAAWAAQQAGHAEQAAELAEEAYKQTRDPDQRAELAYVRSFWLFEKDAAAEAGALLLAHARDSRTYGREMLRAAATYAWFGGDVAALHRAAALLEEYGDAAGADDRRADRAVRGLAHLAAGDFARGLPTVTDLLDDAPVGTPPRLQALSSGSLLPDDVQLSVITEEIDFARGDGLIGRLPYLLHVLARQQLYAGDHREAERTVTEAAAIARDTGLAVRIGRLHNLLARVPAIEGDEERVRTLVTPGMNAGGNYGITALALLDLGLGRYEAALTRLAEAGAGAARYSAALLFATADEVEAAVRLGAPDRAAAPARRFDAWAAASGQPWAQAVALRNEALLAAEPGAAETAYAEAVRLHAEPRGRPFERARTELLFGEHLRRERRRGDARTHLRTALGLFDGLAAAPWSDRARAELRAAGDAQATARATAPDPADRLTPQELQVVRLAAEGTSSRDIAARLFLSPRTVEYHLYKAYPKLGVTSRRELPAALAAMT